MYPIYKFELTAGSTTQQAYPIYGNDLSKSYEKESGQEFFRAKLSGKLTFQSEDYAFIVGQAFDTQFVLEIFISTNAGVSWASYWRGTFWKTDCEFDGDAETVVVQPTVLDQYNDIIAGLDKEYNLIELAPEITPIKADKRPAIQVYVPNQSVIGCFLSGMWWEQECEPVSDTEMVDIGGGAQGRKLEYYYHFALNKGFTNIRISGTTSPQLPEMASGVSVGTSGKYFDFTVGDYHYFRRTETNFDSIHIVNTVSNESWKNERVNRDLAGNYSVTLYPTAGSGATGDVDLSIETIDVYARYLCDVETIGQDSTFPIPNDDFVDDNRNYRRVIGYQFPDTIFFSNRHVETPTQWGLYQPGEYYQQPYSITDQEFFPIARNGWGFVSVWFLPFVFDYIFEESARQPFTIRYAYPLWSVLQVLLNKVAPNVTFRANDNFSQFFYPYENNPITGLNFRLFITPKSNIVTAGYDQPAQKAPITLRDVFDMLRDCFRCYWFVDEQNNLHIEHVLYFKNGGSYENTPIVGIDLTRQTVSRNGKPWAFAKDQYKFDKPEMAARYQFGWADDVTQLFEGFPINILSKYVNPDNIEQINVTKFTSDIDYILLNPSAISKDGFVLLGAKMADPPVVVYDLTSYNTRNYNISPSTLKWGTNSTYKHILVPVEAGRTIRITSNANNGARIAWLTNNNAAASGGNVPYVPDTSLITQNANTTQNYTVPGTGTVYMYIYYGPSATNPSFLPSSMEEIGISSGYELPYINFVVDGNNHYLQNAYVAFCMLQAYYAYDMPAPNYEINGVQFTAQGVKKLKNQTISFPVLTDPDLVELVKTNLGNGMIQKLSINLSSRNANATLKYDTE